MQLKLRAFAIVKLAAPAIVYISQFCVGGKAIQTLFP